MFVASYRKCVGPGTACEIDTKLAYSDHASMNVPLFAIQF